MSLSLPDLGKPRTRAFFWLGLAILPMFWVWWMGKKNFSTGQRLFGWIWTLAHVGTLTVYREPLAEYALASGIGCQGVAVRLTLTLAVWLMFRLVGVWNTMLFATVMTDTIAIMASLVVPALNRQPWMSTVWIFVIPAVLAFVHLMLEPVRLWVGQVRER